MRLTPPAWAGIALATGMAAGPALAQDAGAARSLAATCAACHGTQGRAIDGAAVPGLAGLPATYMVEQMKGFKSGARTATVRLRVRMGISFFISNM